MKLRTVTLPWAPGVPWGPFFWAAKASGDELHYRLDATDWLLDAGATIAAVTVDCSPGLFVTDEQTLNGTAVVLQVSGGVPGTQATVGLRLVLSNQDVLNVTVALPITAGEPPGLLPAWPPSSVTAGAVSVAGTPITVGGVPIQI